MCVPFGTYIYPLTVLHKYVQLVRLLVAGCSSLLDLVFALLSEFFLKEHFLILPTIQKIYADRINADNRGLSFAWMRARLTTPSVLIKEKRACGLHYHRSFRDFSGGHQEDKLQVDKAVGGKFIVKVAYEDVAGKFIKISPKENSTRAKYKVCLVDVDSGDVEHGLPVVDVNTSRLLGTAGGAMKKNKLTAFYGIQPKDYNGNLGVEVDLAGFGVPPLGKSGAAGSKSFQLQLRREGAEGNYRDGRHIYVCVWVHNARFRRDMLANNALHPHKRRCLLFKPRPLCSHMFVGS